MKFLIFNLVLYLAANATIINFNLPSYTLDQKVYITGNSKNLCNWNPQCIELKKNGQYYQVNIDLDENTRFKITRGSWDTEAVDKNGTPIHEFDISQINQVIKVNHWKDQVGRYHQDMLKNDLIRDINEGLLIIGSSSARLWYSADQDFLPLKAKSIGAGGATIEDLWQYRYRLIVRHKPEKLLIYAGENDLVTNEAIEKTFEEYMQLLFFIKKYIPKTKLYCLAIKVSPARESFKNKILRYNQKLEKIKQCRYIDLNTPLQDQSGNIRTDIWKNDNLHLNSIGYGIWAKKIISDL